MSAEVLEALRSIEAMVSGLEASTSIFEEQLGVIKEALGELVAISYYLSQIVDNTSGS